jgi:hypothetical protein
MKFQIGAMSVGDILDRGLKLLVARLPIFYAINLIILVPLILLQMALPFIQSSERPGSPEAALATLGWFFFYALLSLILQPLATAAILYVISQEFVGEHPGIGAAFRFGFHWFGRVLGASFLAGMIVGVGLLFCLVPGIIFLIWYSFVAQVVVVEGLAWGRALSRSKDLSEGYRLRVFGLLALFIVMGVILGAALGILQVVIPTQELVVTESGPAAVPNLRNTVIHNVMGALVNILVGTFQAICMTLLYFDLRIRKEGFDLELAAREHATIIS